VAHDVDSAAALLTAAAAAAANNDVEGTEPVVL